jgi:hypothetical protein
MLHVVAAFSLIVPMLAGPVAPAPPVPVLDDTRGLTHKTYSVPHRPAPRVRRERAASATPPVGTSRDWLGLNDVEGGFYGKSFTLRGVGRHVEVWVADDLAFPGGDCRSDPVEVTDAQVGSLVTEFDTKIFPGETAAFSTPPDRDGSKAKLDGDFTGAGDRTVTLVDNVRDDNYFDFPAAPTYIAGFFSAQLNEAFDRNVMTIDAYDWKHRSGANPPDEATGDPCTSRPARARLYEGTFAHEWQHLLQHYVDPDEALWINEGLSDYAQTLTGYVDATRSVHRHGADIHLACFQGFGSVKTRFNTTPRECGGPQNSLNLWDEGTPSEVLADYGNAYQFMLYLRDRYGAAALSALHRDGGRQGLAAVAAVLPDPIYDVIHDFQTMTLVDKLITPRGKRFSAASLRSTVNLDNPSAYDQPGAAPNGADYVPLPVRGRDLRSVRFDGARTFPPAPLAWTASGGALFSGNTSAADSAAVVEVRVGKKKPELRISTRYATEATFDFGYVTVSTDGGKTYTAIKGDHTVAGPLGPGITGSTGAKFVPHTYNLSAYAGRKILLAFRYVTDAAIDAGGWYVDDITVGSRAIASTPAVFRSPTQIVPARVHHWETRLVGIAGTAMRQVPLDRFAELAAYPKVVAVISYDDPTETVQQYAPYQLKVNGVRQPGGTATMPGR